MKFKKAIEYLSENYSRRVQREDWNGGYLYIQGGVILFSTDALDFGVKAVLDLEDFELQWKIYESV